MALALPRTLDKARAKEREQLAAKAGALKTIYRSITPRGNDWMPPQTVNATLIAEKGDQ